MARVLAGVAGSQLGLVLAGRTRRRVGPLEVTARLSLARRGGFRVDVPPLGSATIRSHRGPLKITAAPTAVAPERAAALAEQPDLAAAGRAASDDARRLATALATRSSLAALGGAATTAGLVLHRPRDIATATATAAGLLASCAVVAAATADRDAWRTPELDGLLTRAPLLLGDLRTAPQRIASYRDQLADLLRTGSAVYRAVATLPEPPPDDAIRLLHVSDIHLSPLALPLAKALVEQYAVAAVLDTGDLVDWGTPTEQAFAAQVGGLGAPYVFVKGNHDSAGIAEAVARQPNATVLDGTTEEVAGLRMTGMADPRFTPDKTTGDDLAEHRVLAAAREFAKATEGADLALVHDPAAARALQGHVPLVLAGHTHVRRTRRYGDTLVRIEGSTGGSGLRGVQRDPHTPIELSVLYVDKRTKRLHTVDEISLGGLGSVALTVQRKTVDDL
ncbi:MAG TPA: metallophosphoesterase [Jatrophihabitans sp.]|nr:metallophosphoesterase [Jatrophihabitans sp.]